MLHEGFQAELVKFVELLQQVAPNVPALERYHKNLTTLSSKMSFTVFYDAWNHPNHQASYTGLLESDWDVVSQSAWCRMVGGDAVFGGLTDEQQVQVMMSLNKLVKNANLVYLVSQSIGGTIDSIIDDTSQYIEEHEHKESKAPPMTSVMQHVLKSLFANEDATSQLMEKFTNEGELRGLMKATQNLMRSSDHPDAIDMEPLLQGALQGSADDHKEALEQARGMLTSGQLGGMMDQLAQNPEAMQEAMRTATQAFQAEQSADSTPDALD